MNMMPQPQGMMGSAMPQTPMPSPEEIEEAKLVAEAIAWEEIEPILRTDERRNYNIDIETDSTVFEDAEAEKAARVECVTAITAMLERGVPAIQMNPKLAPLMKELGMFTLGAFKIGRTLEETFEETFDQLGNIEPQPNPEQQKLDMEAKAKEAEFAQKSMDREQDMMFKEKEHQLKIAGQQADLAFKEKEMGFKERELGMKAQESQFNRQLQAEMAMMDRQDRAEDRRFQQETQQYDRDYREREMSMKNEDAQYKRYDMEERRKFDIEDRTAKREMETQQQQQKGDPSGELAAAIQSVASQIQAIAQQQQETTQTITAIVSYMTAPKTVKRNAKGEAIGVEVGKNEAKDMREMLERLTSGQRSIVRNQSNRIEAFA